MPKKLTRKDYETILRYYNVPFDKTTKMENVKREAEKVLSDKLCRCIKKVTEKPHPDGEKRAIALCKVSILHKKGLTDMGFGCKKQKGITIRRRGGKRGGTRNNRTRRLR